MKKFDVLNQISKAGVVAVVRGKNAEEAIKISDACIKGGVTSIELTYTVPGARRIIEDLVAKYADNKEVLIGAGSVLDPVRVLLKLVLNLSLHLHSIRK